MTPEAQPQAATRPDLSKLNRPFRPEEHGFRPRPSPAHLAERRRADQMIDDTYPGKLVAYVDNWTGDTLDRVVVAASDDAAEFQRLLAALDPDTRRRIDMMNVPEADVIEVPSVFLD